MVAGETGGNLQKPIAPRQAEPETEDPGERACRGADTHRREPLTCSATATTASMPLDQAVIELLGAIVEEVAETHGVPTAEAGEEEITKSVQLRTAAANIKQRYTLFVGQEPDFTFEDRQAPCREASRRERRVPRRSRRLPTRMVEQRSAAYRAALEELGVEFAAPETLNFDCKGSSKDALKVFHDAARRLPTESFR